MQTNPDSVDRTIPVPLHTQISTDFRSRISTGLWPPHYRLKPEPELAESLGISRGTLRRAIGTLVDEGLVVHMRGRGTFVASTVLEPAIAQRLTTLSEDFAAQGVIWRTTVISAELVKTPSPAALLLDIPATGTVFRLVRLGCTDAGPVAHLVNYVRADLAPGIERVDFGSRSLFGVLEREYGLHIQSGRRTFAAGAAPEDVAEALGLDHGVPLQYLEQITYLADSRPVEYSEVWIDSSKLRVTSMLSRR